MRAIASVVKLSGVRRNCKIWRRDVHGYMRCRFVVVFLCSQLAEGSWMEAALKIVAV